MYTQPNTLNKFNNISTSLMGRVGLNIVPCRRFGGLQQFSRRLKLKTGILSVDLTTEQGTYGVLAKIRPAVRVDLLYHGKDSFAICIAVGQRQQWQDNCTQGAKTEGCFAVSSHPPTDYTMSPHSGVTQYCHTQ